MNPGDEQNAGTPGPGPEPRPKPSGGTGGGSRRDSDLIREALEQATPREGSSSVVFPGGLPAVDIFPGYEILREIHRGGQGVVYQAIQKTTRRKVAIKLLHGGPFSGQTGRSRFEREVQVLGQLNHPNIVRIHDSGSTQDGSFFYVMDYISGRSLEEQISEKRLGVEETLSLFVKICDAINAAHLKGVIHRDIKPSNIRIDSNGEPIIVDFGLAKVAVPDVIDGEDARRTPQLMTLTGQFIGSLPWASPEQAEGAPGNIDVRTDVYSLGVVLYQMLTGQFPYRVIGNMRDVLDNILRAEPAKPSTVRRQVDDEVETIVLKCLSKERDRRYQSAGELGRDIRHYLLGEPIEAKRDSTAYMLGKALHRYRTVVYAGATAVAMLAVFGVVSWTLYRQTAAAEKKTSEALAQAVSANEAKETQRLRAERNFRAGHDLAMVMINQVNDEISSLRGATKAREILLKEAQAYLERLRTEAGDDPDLLLDLASAYDKVGDLQGLMYMRRLGETSAAERNHLKAKQIREQLIARMPQDPRMHIGMARSYLRVASAAKLKGDSPKARDALVSAVAAYDRAFELARTSSIPDLPLSLWTNWHAWAIRALGDTQRQMGRNGIGGPDAAGARQLLEQASASYEKSNRIFAARVVADPADVDAQRGVVVLLDAQAAVLLASASGHRAEAIAAKNAGKPEDAFKLLTTATDEVLRARALSEQALDRFTKLAAEYPTSAELRRDQMTSRRNIALTWTDAAKIEDEVASLPGHEDARARGAAAHEQALSWHQQAAAIARRLGDEDARSLEARRDLAGSLNDVGNELRTLGRLDEAEVALEESLKIREELAKTDPLERHEQDRAVGQMRLGQFELERAKAASGEARAAALTRAKGLLKKSTDAFRTLREAGVDGAEAQHVESQKLLDAADALAR